MNMVERLSIFAAGAVVGVLAAKTYFSTKYKQQAEEEIRQMRDYIQKKEAKIKEAEREHSEFQEFEDEDTLSSPDNFASLARDEEAKSAYFKYATKYATTTPITDISKEDFDAMKERLAGSEHPEEEHDEPYILTVEEFEDGKPGYDSIGLSYYRGDDSLVDDAEELVDVDETVGEENLDVFRRSDQDSIYIRNDRIGVVYEIIAIDGNFYDDIFTEGDE